MAKLLTIQLIVSKEKLLGDGKQDPYRRALQFFSTDGELLLEYDHHKGTTNSINDLIKFLEKVK